MKNEFEKQNKWIGQQSIDIGGNFTAFIGALIKANENLTKNGAETVSVYSGWSGSSILLQGHRKESDKELQERILRSKNEFVRRLQQQILNIRCDAENLRRQLDASDSFLKRLPNKLQRNLEARNDAIHNSDFMKLLIQQHDGLLRQKENSEKRIILIQEQLLAKEDEIKAVEEKMKSFGDKNG